MGHRHGGIVGVPLTAVHAVAVFVKGVEPGIGIPRLVVMDAVYALAQFTRGGLDVVAKTVIGGVGQHCKHGPDLLIRNQRAGGYLPRDGLWRQLTARHGANQTPRITARQQVQRNSARHVQRVIQRFMAITVNQYGITIGHRRMQNDLVARRAASYGEEGVVRPKHPSRIFFCRRHRSGMIV